MAIHLSEHFTYSKLLRFTIPSMGMMIFTSLYGIVDGLFVSNLVGKTPFAAINLIWPYLMVFSTVGFMIGTGGSALVSKTMGQGDRKRANELFSMLVVLSLVLGLLFSALGIASLRPVARFLGADGAILNHCVLYGQIILLALPFYILQNVFQSFCITAERPNMGLWLTVAAGVTNILLDALLVYLLRMGLMGAAIATAVSQLVGGLVPLIYFLRPNQSALKLVRPIFHLPSVIKTCTNGSSELVSNLSLSFVGMLYNFQLMRFAGEDGVAAYGVIMYTNFIFIGIFLGYALGIAPVVGYHYGAENVSELKNLRRKSLRLILLLALVLTGLGLIMARPLSLIFVSYDQALLDMTVHAFRVISFSFLFIGFNMFTSSFFTALNDGFISALVSFSRTFLFQSLAVLLLPVVLELEGVWWASLISEICALTVYGLCLLLKLKKYQY